MHLRYILSKNKGGKVDCMFSGITLEGDIARLLTVDSTISTLDLINFIKIK